MSKDVSSEKALELAGYRFMEYMNETVLDKVVIALAKYDFLGDKVYTKFNEKILYSGMTIDEAYMLVLGHDYAGYEARLLVRREANDRELEDHKGSIPNLIEYWIEKGYKVLSPDHWDKWKECVPIRLNDLYRGMELKCTIDIIECLNENNYVLAKERLDDQGHSGMSYSLVKCMVKDFSYKGEDFYRWIDDKG